MAIPYDPVTGINPQDSHFLDREVWDLEKTPADRRPLLLHYHPLVIYRFQVLKQADVVLALFLQGDHFTPRAEAGSTSSTTTRSPPATRRCPGSSSRSSPPRWATGSWRCATSTARCSSTSPTCTATPATACTSPRPAASGTPWSTASAGCATTTATITFDPRLPAGWEGLTFRITLQGTRLQVHLTADAIRFTVLEGGGADLKVRGHWVTVSAGPPVVVPLDDQGPSVDGTITLQTGERRPDGTLITASVPQAAVRRLAVALSSRSLSLSKGRPLEPVDRPRGQRSSSPVSASGSLT